MFYVYCVQATECRRQFEVIHNVHFPVIHHYFPVSARQYNIYNYSIITETCFGAICTIFRLLQLSLSLKFSRRLVRKCLPQNFGVYTIKL
jgi:hypothetical protein